MENGQIVIGTILKDFDGWNTVKKSLEIRTPIFCNSREVWWCSIGANIGTETDGKNELFERPVLVIRVYNINSIVAAPITSKPKDNPYHAKITYDGREGWVILSHARTISSKRLQRKLSRVSETEYREIMRRYVALLTKSAPELTGASEPEGLIKQS